MNAAKRIRGDDMSGEVHVWRIPLKCTRGEQSRFAASLSPRERERAKRFLTTELSSAWVVARGALRCVLAAYLQSEPQSLEFWTDAHGKPHVAGGKVFFNLTHSENLAFVAVSSTGRVGIDAEVITSGLEVEDLARRFFAPSEARVILALPSQERSAVFFAYWTRKEAFLKAVGVGFGFPPDKVRTGIDTDQSMLCESGIHGCRQSWNFVDLSEPGVALALVTEGSKPVVRRYEFPADIAEYTSVANLGWRQHQGRQRNDQARVGASAK